MEATATRVVRAPAGAFRVGEDVDALEVLVPRRSAARAAGSGAATWATRAQAAKRSSSNTCGAPQHYRRLSTPCAKSERRIRTDVGHAVTATCISISCGTNSTKGRSRARHGMLFERVIAARNPERRAWHRSLTAGVTCPSSTPRVIGLQRDLKRVSTPRAAHPGKIFRHPPARLRSSLRRGSARHCLSA